MTSFVILVFIRLKDNIMLIVSLFYGDSFKNMTWRHPESFTIQGLSDMA